MGTHPVKQDIWIICYNSLQISVLKGNENVPADAVSHGINALLQDSFVEYQRFVEEQTKDQQLQLLLQDNTTSLKLLKTRVPSMNLDYVPLCQKLYG